MRKISLSQIHAINWYGYADSIPVSGNLLLAGVTGSGKSILMDLLQFVLIGDRRLVKFNQSATGERSGRDLKGYVLGDLKEEDGGVAQYMRSSAITYAALEFTWPDAERVETWGLRVEFISAAEQQGRVSPWWCQGRLTRSDFLAVTEDGKRTPRELSDWRREVEQRGGEIFHGIEEYRRDMSSPGHLNFDHGILSRLLPTAMSFTFLKSFNEFCRFFILPADRLDVSDVTASYRTFQRYEEELVELHRQLDALKNIQILYQLQIASERDASICRYLQAESSQKHAEEESRRLQKQFDEVSSAAAAETARLNELDASIPIRQEEIKKLESSIGETSDGKLYLHLRSENRILATQINRLRETGTTLETAFDLRIRNARRWSLEVSNISLNIDVATFRKAIDQAESGGIKKAQETIRLLCEAGNKLSTEISRNARPNADRLAEIRKKLGALRDEVDALKLGRLPFPTRVLDTLNHRLLSNTIEPAAQHLCALCEVKDERWRPAIEVVFTRKFAIVVEPDHYDEAERIYHELRAEPGHERESLINPKKALKLDRALKQGSLAEKIETRHPVAAALVSHLFGDLICCDSREQLRVHDAAILSDGFSTRGAFVDRIRHYDNLPFIGKRGLDQQLIWKNARIDELAIQKSTLEPLERLVEKIQEDARLYFEVPSSLSQQLSEMPQLLEKETKLKENTDQLNSIDRDGFDKLDESRSLLDAELRQWLIEQRALLKGQKNQDLERVKNELTSAKETEIQAKEGFSKIKHDYDYSVCLDRIDNLRLEITSQFPMPEFAAKRFELRGAAERSNAQIKRVELVGDRKLFIQKFPKFDDLNVEAEDNTTFARVLSKIDDADIPEYERKSKDERVKWEHLFRSQVLEKLRAALVEVKNIISLLNSSLNKPIGTNSYYIKHAINPDYRIYNEMLGATAVAGNDLFASIPDHQLRDTIQTFLKTLVENSDSAESARLLDYRHYYDYDMIVEDITESDDQRRRISVDKQSAKFSGGENQSPYFIAILASYLRAYRRQDRYRDAPTLGLVPIDEAFSKLSGERISDCIKALAQLDLQGVFSMSTGNIPYAFEQCDHLLVVSKEERRVGRKLRVRNIAVSIARESEEGRQFMQDFA